MIHALRYESQGQRQRFGPQEQQSGEAEEKHIHLHLHLDLTFRARKLRVTPPYALRIVRACAVLVAATILHLGVFICALLVHNGPPDPLLTWGHLAWAIVLAGLALAWVCGGFPVLVSAWRVSSYRVRFLLVGLLLSIPLHLQLGSWFPSVLLILFVAHSIISALLLVWVSYEVFALRQSTSTYTMSSFALVSGMALMLLGGFLVDLSFIIGGVTLLLVILPFAIGTAFPAIIVAIRTLSGPPFKVQPKDDTTSEINKYVEPPAKLMKPA